jgi:hypothetical protein
MADQAEARSAISFSTRAHLIARPGFFRVIDPGCLFLFFRWFFCWTLGRSLLGGVRPTDLSDDIRRCAEGRLTACRRFVRAGFAALLLVPVASNGRAQEALSLPTLHTNEQYVADVTKRSVLEIENVRAVLEYVLGQLPDRVSVFPTENYYYFYFYQNGIQYAGNFRFNVDDRDRGEMEFFYFRASTDLIRDGHTYGATLSSEDGVLVERAGDLAYRVTFAGKSVTFLLNNLASVTPPSTALGETERFLGPVADESGIRFFLVFDEDLKMFHYVLDETVPVADELLALPGWDHILIGGRTSFAFFADPALDRKLLVGVFEPNAALNNYLDGPFDQLPDNFLKGDELRRALLLAQPDLDTSIDRLGIYPGGEFRAKIASYTEYLNVEDLAPAEKCGAEKEGKAVYLCLNDLYLENREEPDQAQ